MEVFTAFCVGFIVGGILGVIIMTIVVGAKMSREWEIEAAIDHIEGSGEKDDKQG